MAAAASASSAAGRGAAPKQPNVIEAVRFYVDKMIRPKGMRGGVPGMKVLLMDDETKSMVSMAIGMTDILDRDVFFVGTLGAERDSMPHMKAIVFCRATVPNLRMLAEELASPKHSEYHIYLSNIAPPAFLDELAKADVHSKVEQVHEFYADFHAISPEVFSLNLSASLHLAKPTGGAGGRMTAAEARFQRSVDGVMSVLLAHKLKPVIRFQQTSSSAGHFARAVDAAIGSQRELFSLLPHASQPPVLLVLDRREDPVTPLLTQWTYQAMIHETLGLWGNRVVIPGSKAPAAGAAAAASASSAGASKAVTHVVDAAHDPFYAEHMCSHFVDVAEAVQAQLKEVQRRQRDTSSMASIDDMRRVMERLPAMRRENANAVKHFNIMAELHRQDEAHKLFELTRLEQDMAEQDAAARHATEVAAMLDDPAVRNRDALRLVLLFALRYETDAPGRVADLKVALASRGLLPGDVAMVDALLDYAGARVRGGDLFSKKTMMARFRRGVSRSLKGLQEADTPHKPILDGVLKDLSAGTLSTSLYPFAGRAEAATSPAGMVVVFVLGGATFEEAHAVHALNNTPGSTMRVILGGTVVQNSEAFVDDLAQLAKEAAGGMATPGPAAAGGGPTAPSTSVFGGEGLGFGTGLVQQRGGSSYGTLS